MSENNDTLRRLHDERVSRHKPSDDEHRKRLKEAIEPFYNILMELAKYNVVNAVECLEQQHKLNAAKSFEELMDLGGKINEIHNKWIEDSQKKLDAEVANRLQAQREQTEQAARQLAAQQAAQQLAAQQQIAQQQVAQQLLQIAKTKFERGATLSADEVVLLATDVSATEPDLLLELDEICEFCDTYTKNRHHDKWCTKCIRFHEDRARSAKVNTLKRQLTKERNEKIKILKTAKTIQKTRNPGNRK